MNNQDINAIDLRLAVLGTAVAALARSLSPREAARASVFFSEQVNGLIGSQRLTERGEDSILVDLARILEALQRPESLAGGPRPGAVVADR